MGNTSLTVDKREEFGKNAAGRMRRAGRVPGILYGEGKEPLALSVETRSIQQLMATGRGENSIFDLCLTGTDQRRPVMIKQVQRQPITGAIEHCDFIRISMDKVVEVGVPLVLTGVSPGVKDFGGLQEFILRELEIECLPDAIPDNIVVDISQLMVGDAVRVADLVLPTGVVATSDPGHIIVQIAQPALEKPEKEVGVAAAAAPAAEPEVIRKGKEGPEAGA